MIPIFDSLSEHISMDDIKQLIAENKIITIPLAFMRGITFKNSFVLLDEAQNTTVKQMHLFITRIGQNSKMVITGDSMQSDIGYENGFVDAIERLDGVDGVARTSLDPKSVVRHGIIPAINARYENKLGRKEPNSNSI